MAYIHVRIKPQYLTVRIISTFIDYVCFIFLKRFFVVRHRRNLAILLKIRATSGRTEQKLQLTVTL